LVSATKAKENQVSLMPQSRWPIVATSISGIAPEIWQVFKARVDARGMTGREAMEAPILEPAKAVRAGEDHAWPHTRKAPLHTLRMHGAVKARLRELVNGTGLKQSAVGLAAIRRRMAKEGASDSAVKIYPSAGQTASRGMNADPIIRSTHRVL
jgi:hypothetical protein